MERLGNILYRLENDNPKLNIVGAYWLGPDSDQQEGALVIHVSHSVSVGTLQVYGSCYDTVAFPWTLPTEDNTTVALGMDETPTPALPHQTVPDEGLTDDDLDYDASCSFQRPPQAPPTDIPNEHLEMGWNVDPTNDLVKDLFSISTEELAQVVGMTNMPSQLCTNLDTLPQQAYAEFETPVIDNSIETHSVPYDPELGHEAQLMAHTLPTTACSTSGDYPDFSAYTAAGEGFDPCAPTAVDPMFMPTPPPTQSPSLDSNSVALSPGPSLFPPTTTHCICLTLACSYLCMPDGNAAMAFATSKFPFTEATIFSFTRAVELGGHRQLKYQKIDDAVKRLDREFAEQTRRAMQDAYTSLFLGMPAASDGNAMAASATAQLKLALTEAVISSFIHSVEQDDFKEVRRQIIEDVVKDLDTVFADQTRRAMWLADAEAEEEIL